ncbi:helix-turn-helix domain-containing protein [Methylomonas sp. 2BW1-5-20]|uniref:helix-turn-helix domain-containing protein n=1 Tax=Methylomonas sp. 2BW1-5-20 TaxID=3376686 RepID=UPI00404CB4A7
MQTLNLEEAARLLKLHPSTVLAKARAGDIPAAKPGKCWVFIDEDLIAWLRGMYAKPPQGTIEGSAETQARPKSLKKLDMAIGVTNLPSMEKLYTDLLAPRTKARRNK